MLLDRLNPLPIKVLHSLKLPHENDNLPLTEDVIICVLLYVPEVSYSLLIF